MATIDIVHIIFGLTVISSFIGLGKMLFVDDGSTSEYETGVLVFSILCVLGIAGTCAYLCFQPINTLSKIMLGVIGFLSFWGIGMRLSHNQGFSAFINFVEVIAVIYCFFNM